MVLYKVLLKKMCFRKLMLFSSVFPLENVRNMSNQLILNLYTVTPKPHRFDRY